MLLNKKESCDNCSFLMENYRFGNPKQYLSILNDMAEAVSSGQFVITEQTCDFNRVQHSTGTWHSDSLSHSIRCIKCGAYFTCNCDTYHGNGSFEKHTKQGE